MKPFIVTITGPSCAGKSTLESWLRESGFASLVSTTTRLPRFGEEHGKNYYFVSKEEFERTKSDGGFVESVEFDGNCYGVSTSEAMRVAALGHPIVVVVEPHGKAQIENFCRKHGWHLLKVYVTNPSKVIAERFLRRLVTDIEGAKNRVGIVARYAQRMSIMMTDERVWNTISELPFQYDLRVDEFNELTAPEVIDTICAIAVRYGYLTEQKVSQA